MTETSASAMPVISERAASAPFIATPSTRSLKAPLYERIAELVAQGVAPQPLETVERAAVAAEDVDDEVEVVEQDPFRLVEPFGERRPLVQLLLQRLVHRIGHRRDLARVAAPA